MVSVVQYYNLCSLKQNLIIIFVFRSVSGRISSASRSTSVTPKIPAKKTLNNSTDTHNSTASSGSHILSTGADTPHDRTEVVDVHSAGSSLSGSRSLGSPKPEHSSTPDGTLDTKAYLVGGGEEAMPSYERGAHSNLVITNAIVIHNQNLSSNQNPTDIDQSDLSLTGGGRHFSSDKDMYSINHVENRIDKINSELSRQNIENVPDSYREKLCASLGKESKKVVFAAEVGKASESSNESNGEVRQEEQNQGKDSRLVEPEHDLQAETQREIEDLIASVQEEKRKLAEGDRSEVNNEQSFIIQLKDEIPAGSCITVSVGVSSRQGSPDKQFAPDITSQLSQDSVDFDHTGHTSTECDSYSFSSLANSEDLFDTIPYTLHRRHFSEDADEENDLVSPVEPSIQFNSLRRSRSLKKKRPTNIQVEQVKVYAGSEDGSPSPQQHQRSFSLGTKRSPQSRSPSEKGIRILQSRSPSGKRTPSTPSSLEQSPAGVRRRNYFTLPPRDSFSSIDDTASPVFEKDIIKYIKDHHLEELCDIVSGSEMKMAHIDYEAKTDSNINPEAKTDSNINPKAKTDSNINPEEKTDSNINPEEKTDSNINPVVDSHEFKGEERETLKGSENKCEADSSACLEKHSSNDKNGSGVRNKSDKKSKNGKKMNGKSKPGTKDVDEQNSLQKQTKTENINGDRQHIKTKCKKKVKNENSGSANLETVDLINSCPISSDDGSLDFPSPAAVFLLTEGEYHSKSKRNSSGITFTTFKPADLSTPSTPGSRPTSFFEPDKGDDSLSLLSSATDTLSRTCKIPEENVFRPTSPKPKLSQRQNSKDASNVRTRRKVSFPRERGYKYSFESVHDPPCLSLAPSEDLSFNDLTKQTDSFIGYMSRDTVDNSEMIESDTTESSNGESDQEVESSDDDRHHEFFKFAKSLADSGKEITIDSGVGAEMECSDGIMTMKELSPLDILDKLDQIKDDSFDENIQKNGCNIKIDFDDSSSDSEPEIISRTKRSSEDPLAELENLGIAEIASSSSSSSEESRKKKGRKSSRRGQLVIPMLTISNPSSPEENNKKYNEISSHSVC
jgi:hypothetical protein